MLIDEFIVEDACIATSSTFEDLEEKIFDDYVEHEIKLDNSYPFSMTDQQLISQLIAHDPQVTAQFFFRDCRPLLVSVIRRVFGTQIVDYDEIISEIYILLMENDAKKLRSFKFESTLYQWLKTIAIRHCLLLKSKKRVIDDESQEPLNNSHREHSLVESSQARMDMETLLRQMKNQRYTLVI